MGLKHLRDIRKVLEDNSGWLSKSEIRGLTGADHWTVIDCLDYLFNSQGVIEKRTFKGKGGVFEKYKWKVKQ